MNDTHDRSTSRRPFLIFALLTALIAVAVFLSLREFSRDSLLVRTEERDIRILHLMRARAQARIRSVLARIEGAELFIAEKPPSRRNAARALAFALRKGEEGPSHSAAVVLDERGGILSSRRQGGAPPPSGKERSVWRRAVSALRTQKRTFGGKFHIEADVLEGVAAVFITALSPSTKGYWGVILPAEELFQIGAQELGARENVFLLTIPDHSVIFARQGEKFLHEAIGRTFEKNLALALGILACCDAAAFNTLHEGDRFMVLLELPAGTREIQLVRVSDRRKMGPAKVRNLPLIGGAIAAGWIFLLGMFLLLGRMGTARAPAGAASKATRSARPAPPVSRDVLSALLRVGESVAGGESFREVISRATEEAARRIGADRAYSALYDEGMNQLFEVYSSGMGEGYRAAIGLRGEGLPESIAIQESDIVEVTSVGDWSDAPDALKEEGSGAVAVFPMKSGENLIGLLSFHFDAPNTMGDEEIDFCTLLVLHGAESVARALSLAEPPPES